MKINFTKMHGIGNDYIYVDCTKKSLPDPEKISIAMSPRRFSVGADGLILICPSNVADVKMRMFNADGSEGKMCGNGIRCVGKFVYDNKIAHKDEISVETLAGIKYLKITAKNDKAEMITVDMGYASFAPEQIPIAKDQEHIQAAIRVQGKEYRSTAVSMGNPHNVLYVEDPAVLDLEKIGPDFENHELFPEKVNTEFVKVIDSHTLQMRVWERGSGETWACGTGACAIVAASVKNGLVPAEEPIEVRLVGGTLSILCKEDYRIFMTGPATKVYDGVYEYED